MDIKIKIVSEIKMMKCIHILLGNVKLGSTSKGFLLLNEFILPFEFEKLDGFQRKMRISLGDGKKQWCILFLFLGWF